MALASCPARQGQQRSLRRIRQFRAGRLPFPRCAELRARTVRFLSRTEPGSAPDTHRMPPAGLAMTCRFIPCCGGCCPSRTGGPRRPGRPGSASRPGPRGRTRPFFASRTAFRSLGARSAGSPAVSFTYLQAVAVPTPNRLPARRTFRLCAGKPAPAALRYQRRHAAQSADRDQSATSRTKKAQCLDTQRAISSVG